MPPPRKISPPPDLHITTIEACITVEAKVRGTTMWIKVGAVADAGAEQNPTIAYKRLAAWVEKRALEKVGELLA